MVSVSQFIKNTKQPRGGYLPISRFDQKKISEAQEELSIKDENIHPSIVGMAVDYLTRYNQGSDSVESFNISIAGALKTNDADFALYLLNKIVNGDKEESIESACKIVAFDMQHRVGYMTKSAMDINPDQKTIENIDKMLSLSDDYLDSLGGATLSGFSFYEAYDGCEISVGDADFLTETSLVDFKVSTTKPSTSDTFQILIYYILGLRSFLREDFEKIEYLRFFNPRLNSEWSINVDNIDKDIIKIVENLIYK